MGSSVLSILAELLGGIDADALGQRGQAWLDEHAAEYPDAEGAKQALSEFLTTELSAAKPELDAEKIRATIYGVASDIMRGSAGVDPNAQHGMV